jgi:hypothetical protein
VNASAAAVWSAYVKRLLGDNHNFIMSCSQMDPASLNRGWVTCNKHETYKAVRFDGNHVPSDDELLKAAQSCEKCMEEIAAMLPPTRWPEGAEL